MATMCSYVHAGRPGVTTLSLLQYIDLQHTYPRAPLQLPPKMVSYGNICLGGSNHFLRMVFKGIDPGPQAI